MKLTKSASYSSVKESIKGVTSLKTQSFLNDALSKGDPSKITKFHWNLVSDLELVLITIALVVTIEKKCDNYTSIENCYNDDIKNKFKTLFANIAKGISPSESTLGGIEPVFKILMKEVAELDEIKTNSIWQKYSNRIKRMSKWSSIGRHALIRIKPALKSILSREPYEIFKSNLGPNKKFMDKMPSVTIESFVSAKLILHTRDRNVELYIYDNTLANQPWVKIDHTVLPIYYQCCVHSVPPLCKAAFEKDKLHQVIKQKKPKSLNAFKILLTKHLNSLFKRVYKDLDNFMLPLRKMYAKRTREGTSAITSIKWVVPASPLPAEAKLYTHKEVNIPFYYIVNRNNDKPSVMIMLNREDIIPLFYDDTSQNLKHNLELSFDNFTPESSLLSEVQSDAVPQSTARSRK